MGRRSIIDLCVRKVIHGALVRRQLQFLFAVNSTPKQRANNILPHGVILRSLQFIDNTILLFPNVTIVISNTFYYYMRTTNT